ncbi:uncharacterized protein LOC135500027 isoform X2 [Lineus longissimus]|uniref:uncharacterized protein LOC135500027 isoform X2 n=1 Tax=Lineus longissimus TaxID=88925 RepID=UPI002B4FA2E4
MMASSGFVRKLSQMGWKPKRREKEKEKPKTKKEGLMQDLEKERLLRAETEQRLAEMTAESETTKTRLQGLQDEFRRMEDMVRSMVQYKMKLDQLKQEKANLTVTYEDHIDKYKTQISNLEQENMLMMNKIRKMESQLNERPDNPEKSKLLMERLKSLEGENSALVLENETQRQSYEKCLDEIANQVVQALMTQKCLREECQKLQRRVFELESHNKQLQALMQTRLRHSTDATMIQVMSGKKLTKSRAKSLMLIEGSTQSLPGQRSFIPLRNSLHHASKHTRHYSNSTFTGMEPNVDALPSSTIYDHDYNDNAYCDTPCMPQLSSPPPWLREKLKLIPLNDDTASDNAYQYHSNLDAESLTTKLPRSPKSETPAKSAESKIQQITSRLFTKVLQTDNVDKVLSSKGQHSNHSGHHSNKASCHSNHSACYSTTPGAQDSSFRKQHTQNTAQKSQNFTLDINCLAKHNMKVPNGSDHSQSCLHPSPGRELLCMSDEFEMKFTANAPEGIPVLMKNYDTDDELSDDAESSSGSSSDDQKQDRHSTCSSFSLNDILENGLDVCGSPSDDNFSLDKYPLFLENDKHRKGSLRRSSYDETFGETESLKRQIIQNCKATISTSKLSHSISDTNSVSRSDGNSSPLNVELKRPISLEVLLESAVKRQEEVLKIETEKALSHDPVLTLKEDKSPPVLEREEEKGQRSEQISSDSKIREEIVKEEVRVRDSVKHIFSSGNSDSAFEEQILSPGEDEEVSQPQAQEGKRNNTGEKSVQKETECLKGIFVITETSEKSPAAERKKDGAVAETEKTTNQLQPIRLQVQVEGQRVLRSACSSPGSEYNYERSGSADDGYSTMASDVNPETLENFANAVKPGQLPKDGACKSDSAATLRSNAISTETLKDIPISRSNSKEEEEVFKEDVATIKRISLCELKEIKEEAKESVSSSKSSRRSSEVEHGCEVFETIRRRSRAESTCSVASSTSQASASSVESTSIGRVCDIKGYFEKEADKQRRSAESLKKRKSRPSSEPVRSVPESDSWKKHKHFSEGGCTPTQESHAMCSAVSEPSNFKIQRPNQIRCSLCRSPRKKRNIRTSPIDDCGPSIHSDTSLAFHQSDHGDSHKLVPMERAFSDSELHNSWIDKALESPENFPHNHTFYKHLSVSDLTARFGGRVPGCVAESSDSSLEGLDHIMHDDQPQQTTIEAKQNVLLLSSDSDSDVDASINYVELWRKNHLVHMPVQLPQWDPTKTMEVAKKLLSPPTKRRSEVMKPVVKQPEVNVRAERHSLPASFKDLPKSSDQFAPPTPIGPKLLPKKRPIVPPRMKLDKLDPNVILANSPPRSPRSPVPSASSLSSRTRPTAPCRTSSLSAERRSPSKTLPSKDQNGPSRSSLQSSKSSVQSPKKKVPPPVPKRTSSKLSMPNLSPINKLNGQVSKLPKEGVVYVNTQELKEEETREISRSKIPKFNAVLPQTRIPSPKQGKETQNMKIVHNSQNLEAHSVFCQRDVLPDLISPGCMAVKDYHHVSQNPLADGVNMSAWNVEGCKARPCSYGSQPKLTVDNLQEIDTSLTLSTEALLPIDTHFKRDFYSLCQVDRESNRSTPCNLSAAASLDKLHRVTMNGSLASLKNLPWKTNSDPNCSRLGGDEEEIDEISQQIADLSKTVDDLQKSLSSLNSMDCEAEKCDNVDNNDENSVSWPEFAVSNLSSSLSSLDVSTASLLDSDASSDKYVWMDDDIVPLYDEIHDDTAAFDASDEFDWMSFQPMNIREGSEPRYFDMELEMELKENDEHTENETTEFMDPETRDNILDAIVGTDSDDDDFIIGNDPEMREIAGKMPRRRRQKKKGKRAVVRHAVHTRPHVDFKTFFNRYEDAEKKALSHFNFLKKYLDEIENGSNPGSPISPDGDHGITDVSNRENIAPDHVPKEMPLPGIPRDLVLPGGGCQRLKWSPEQVDPRLSPISEKTEAKETKKTGREKMTAFSRLKSLSLDNKKDAKESLKLGKELDKKAKEEKKAKDTKPKLRFGFKGLNGSKRRASAPITTELVPPIASTSSETCVNQPKMTELEKAIALSTPDIRGDGGKGSKGSLERPGSPQFGPKDGSNVRKSSSVKVRKSSATKVFVKKDKSETDVLDSHLLRSQSAKTARTAPKGKKTIADKVQETPLKPVPTPSGGSPKRQVARIDSRIPKSSKKSDAGSNATNSSSPAASISTNASSSSSPPQTSPEPPLQTPDIVPRHQDIPLPPIPTERKSERKQKTEIKKRAELKRKTEMKKPDVALKLSDKKTDPKSPQKTSPTAKQSRLPVSAKDKRVVDTPLWAPPKGTAGKSQGPPVKGRSPSDKQPEVPRRKSLLTTEGARNKSQRSKKIVDTELVLPPIRKDGNESDMSHASSLSEEIFNQLSMSFDDRCKTILGKDDDVPDSRVKAGVMRDPYLDNFSLSDSCTDSCTSSNDDSTEHSHALYSQPQL